MALTTPIPADPAEAQQPESRSALLFISGLGSSEINTSADGIAGRVSHALNRRAAQRKATYAVLPGSNQVQLAEDVSLARATIQRTAPDEPSTALDVWHLATAEGAASRGYGDSKLYVKALRGAPDRRSIRA